MQGNSVSFRAVTIGLLLGLSIAGGTYFNDQVIGLTLSIGNQLPICVFGSLIVLLLVVNPALRSLGARWPLGRGELALVAAMGLAVCGWPGSNLFRSFVGKLALPGHYLKTNASWQAAGVMSYVPGGSPLLADGYVRDWELLAKQLSDAAGGDTGAGHLWVHIEADAQRFLRHSAEGETLNSAQRQRVLAALNEVIASADLYDDRAFAAVKLPRQAHDLIEQLQTGQRVDERQRQRLNRYLVQSTLAGSIGPMPEGTGLLVAGGGPHPFAVDTIVYGWDGPKRLGLADLPWDVWWPVLRLWGGVSLLLAFAALCLAVIVHPQWSQRERLPYPIVRFLEEASAPGAGRAGRWPEVARSRAFWIAFVILIAYHAVNAVHTWFPEAIGQIPPRLDFTGLEVLFPNASRVSLKDQLFEPHLYLSVIAFTFFLNKDVSLSLGLTGVAWLALGAILIRNGIAFSNGFVSTDIGPMLRFGAYLGTAMMLAYIGRRYYANVLTSAFGWRRKADTPVESTWAARFLLLCALGAIFLLARLGGLGWLLSALAVFLILLIFVIVARVNTETGALFIQPWWTPVGLLTAVFGIQGLGPQGLIVLGLVSIVLVGDPRTALMPFLSNGLRMTDRIAGAPLRRICPLLLVMIVVGFFVALGATMLIMYNRGIGGFYDGGTRWFASMPFNELVASLSKLSSRGELEAATAVRGLGHIGAMNPQTGALLWVALGMLLVLGFYLARLRLSWWPLHPVLFLMWGTVPGAAFAFSFFVGWAIKASVMWMGGARTFGRVKPVMIGVIAGELVAAVLNMAVGTIYFFTTGQIPGLYRLLPM